MPQKIRPLLRKLKKLVNFTVSNKPIIISRFNLVEKAKKNFKRAKLLKHYSDYGYVQAFEFSPTRTPSIYWYRNNYRRAATLKKKKKCYCYNRFRSILLRYGCLGNSCGDDGHGIYGDCRVDIVAALPAMIHVDLDDDGGDHDDDSVDERAERFIEKFYEDMRVQRRITQVLELEF